MSKQGNTSMPRCTISIVRRFLFGACTFWAILIIICIGRESFYKEKLVKETSSHVKYIHWKLHPQNEIPDFVANGGIEEHHKNELQLMLNYNDSRDLKEDQRQQHAIEIFRRAERKTRRPKQDRLLPLKIMFANAGKENEETEESFNWNSNQVPLADLRVKRDKLQVLLLVIVSSGPNRQDRRNAIRETWWKKCTGKVSSNKCQLCVKHERVNVCMMTH